MYIRKTLGWEMSLNPLVNTRIQKDDAVSTALKQGINTLTQKTRQGQSISQNDIAAALEPYKVEVGKQQEKNMAKYNAELDEIHEEAARNAAMSSLSVQMTQMIKEQSTKDSLYNASGEIVNIGSDNTQTEQNDWTQHANIISVPDSAGYNMNTDRTTIGSGRSLQDVQQRLQQTVSRLDETAKKLEAGETSNANRGSSLVGSAQMQQEHEQMVQEMNQFNQSNILNQAATAMLAQGGPREATGYLQLLR